MSHWNHRVLRHSTADESDWLEIHEVHYDEKGCPVGCTVDGVSVGGESRDALRWTLQKMLECLDKPALHYDDFPASPDEAA